MKTGRDRPTGLQRMITRDRPHEKNCALTKGQERGFNEVPMEATKLKKMMKNVESILVRVEGREDGIVQPRPFRDAGRCERCEPGREPQDVVFGPGQAERADEVADHLRRRPC